MEEAATTPGAVVGRQKATIGSAGPSGVCPGEESRMDATVREPGFPRGPGVQYMALVPLRQTAGFDGPLAVIGPRRCRPCSSTFISLFFALLSFRTHWQQRPAKLLASTSYYKAYRGYRIVLHLPLLAKLRNIV